MKIKRSVLEKIIREELTAHIRTMMEAPAGQNLDVVDAGADEKSKEKKDKSPDDKDKKSKDNPPEPQKKSKSANDQKGEEPEELPVENEPEADKDLEKDVAGEQEDADEVTGGKIADEVTGKTVQSITMEPKSKTLPGAQELTITFREIPDPLKVLVTKTGQVKFFFKGLHNEV